MDTSILTGKEHGAIQLCGNLAGVLTEIVAPGAQQEHDLNELIGHVHTIQRAIMSQAASRCYPDLYRPLGGWPERETSAH